jgi:apolipoprotein D and lipocalin family protein
MKKPCPKSSFNMAGADLQIIGEYRKVAQGPTFSYNDRVKFGRALMLKDVMIAVIGMMLFPLLGWSMGARDAGPPLETVAKVDLAQYMGTWYEIASYPNSFQSGCTATKATYILRENGKVVVVNECRRGGLEGELTVAKGTAKVVDAVTNAKLKVTFFWPFYGDYWIIDLGKDYEYAVVGHPSRKYLWVLSRSRHMDEASYQGILERLQAQAYDTSRLTKTEQPK